MPKAEGGKTLRSTAAVEPVSRIRKMTAEGAAVPLPPLSAPWMVDMLMEAGPVQPGGMGAMPLSWGELQAWQQQTGRRLPPWQTRMIRELSAVFLAESQRAEKVDCPAPWVSEIDANRKLVAQKLAAAFGARAKRKG